MLSGRSEHGLNSAEFWGVFGLWAFFCLRFVMQVWTRHLKMDHGFLFVLFLFFAGGGGTLFFCVPCFVGAIVGGTLFFFLYLVLWEPFWGPDLIWGQVAV